MKPELLDYEILVKTRALIKDPSHWTQGSNFRKVGMSTSDIENADQFCLRGAVLKATGRWQQDMEAIPAWRILKEVTPTRNDPVFFNDRCSHKDVLALLDMAIAKAKTLAS